MKRQGLLAGRRALIHTPQGRDALVATNLLREGGIGAVVCSDIESLVSSLDEQVTFAMIAEEALVRADLRSLVRQIATQPSWSDLPLIVLTQRGGGLERNPSAARLSELLGNVTFLERPFHPTTLLSVARTALRSRERQFEAQQRMEALDHAEHRLRESNELLERRVAQRSAELERAHSEVLEQIAHRERAEEQLRQAQKMEMVGQLTGGVAHDFNNLLMVVLTNMELLRRRLPQDPLTTRLIEGAMQSARRGAQLTQRLLAFARRQELKLEGHDLGELLRGMRDLLERSVGPAVHIDLRIPDGLPPASVDANQLELAVLNLVVNARDAMPDGGSVCLELDRAHGGKEQGLAPGEYLRVCVIDSGCGMDGETLRRATEPFFSTKPMGKGTGLGLSMIHGLAMQLQGALRLTSTPGQGTRAELWLPRASSITRHAPPGRSDGDATAPGTPGRRVLLVDDDALVLEGTRGMLEALGHEVVTARSGGAALEALDGDDDIDLLITDYSMPHMTGLQLATHVRERRPDLDVLLATGYADLPAGTLLDIPHLVKPYPQEDLAAAIERLNGEVPGPPPPETAAAAGRSRESGLR